MAQDVSFFCGQGSKGTLKNIAGCRKNVSGRAISYCYYSNSLITPKQNTAWSEEPAIVSQPARPSRGSILFPPQHRQSTCTKFTPTTLTQLWVDDWRELCVLCMLDQRDFALGKKKKNHLQGERRGLAELERSKFADLLLVAKLCLEVKWVRNVWEVESWTLLRRNAKIHWFWRVNVEESSYPLLRVLV